MEKRLEEMSFEVQSKNFRKKQTQNMNPIPSTMVLTDDNGRTQYQPKVRILRRESAGTHSSPENHASITVKASIPKTSKHNKSLQQREEEYAQARLRIFGSLSTSDAEDEIDYYAAKNEDSSIRSQSSPKMFKPSFSPSHVTLMRQPREEFSSVNRANSS